MSDFVATHLCIHFDVFLRIIANLSIHAEQLNPPQDNCSPLQWQGSSGPSKKLFKKSSKTHKTVWGV